MVEQVEVDLIVKAIAEGFDSVNSNMKKTTDEADKQKTTMQKLAGGLTDLKNNYMNVKNILGDVQQVLQATVGDWLADAEAIRTLAQYTGATYEETSRMVEVFDDAGVSADKVRVAMKALKDNGLEPNVETVARLSDEYRNIEDPLAKAEFLTKNFGVRGAELGKIFDMTGDEIRAAADEAEAMGLVFDAEDIAKAEEMRKNIDQFNDSIEGLKREIVGGLVPGWNALIDGVKLLNSALDVNRKKSDEVAAAQKAIVDNAKAMPTDPFNAITAQAALERESKSIVQVNDNLARNYTLMAKAASATEETTSATEEYTQAATDMSAEDMIAAEMKRDLIETQEEYAAAAVVEAEKIRAVASAISGPLKSAYETYSEKTSDLKAKNEELLLKIGELTDNGINKNAEGVAELTQQYNDNKTAMDEAAAAYANATAELIYQNSIAGLTAEQQLELGRSLGLVSESDYNTIRATQILNAEFQKTGNMEDYKKGLGELQQAAADGKVTAEELQKILEGLDGFTADATINVTTNVPNNVTQPKQQAPNNPDKPKPQASGGTYDVTQPTTFLAGEAGPETAIFIPRGKSAADVGAGGLGGLHIGVININGAGDPQAVAVAVRNEIDRYARMRRNGMGYAGR